MWVGVGSGGMNDYRNTSDFIEIDLLKLTIDLINEIQTCPLINNYLPTVKQLFTTLLVVFQI